MGRPSNTEQRREEIVQGLLEVMAERGYERASVAEVARAAGLTPGLVHYHFRTKQEILLCLLERLARDLGRRVERRLTRAGEDPGKRLAAFVDAHLALDAEADPRALACWVAITAESIRQPEVGQAFARVLTRGLAQLEELARAALRQRGRSTRQARSVAAAVLSSIGGYCVLAAAAPDVVPTGSAARNVRRIAAALVAGEEG